MIGYKAFNSDLSCRGFQYEIGKIYEMNSKPVCCENGFHFCKDLKNCFYHYYFGSRICEIESLGDLDSEDEVKYCTNKIKIIKELSFEEICDVIGIETIIGEILIKSLELTQGFYRKKCIFLSSGWTIGLDCGPFCWIVFNAPDDMSLDVGAQLSKDFKRIKFFGWGDSNKILFECDDERIYQVEKLEDDYLEWFEYLKNNLKF